MSPLLRPDLAAGLPFATSATMTCPVGEYRSHAPLQAVALPTHDAWASAPAALAFSCAHCEPPAKAGMVRARAKTTAAEATSIFFMFPSGSRWDVGRSRWPSTAPHENQPLDRGSRAVDDERRQFVPRTERRPAGRHG